MIEMITFPVEVTKSGLPSLWEQGGAIGTVGYSQIICRQDGLPKTFTFAPQKGNLACGQHALFVLIPGDIVINIASSLVTHTVIHGLIMRIRSLATKNVALAEIINVFKDGRWLSETGPLTEAVSSAIAKSFDLNCHSIYFGKKKVVKEG